jgi:hypothetical protein
MHKDVSGCFVPSVLVNIPKELVCTRCLMATLSTLTLRTLPSMIGTQLPEIIVMSTSSLKHIGIWCLEVYEGSNIEIHKPTNVEKPSNNLRTKDEKGDTKLHSKSCALLRLS